MTNTLKIEAKALDYEATKQASRRKLRTRQVKFVSTVHERIIEMPENRMKDLLK